MTQIAHAAQQKPEIECERLVKIAQNRDGQRISREEREAALVKLIHDFRYLIRKIARDTWSDATGERFENFEHDTTTTFLELIIDDYVPVSHGGASPFAPYVQSKLYWRMVDKAQRAKNHYRRQFSVSPREGRRGDGGSRTTEPVNSQLDKFILESTFQNITETPDAVIEEFRDDQIRETLTLLNKIASEVLDERQRYVWKHYFFEKTQVREIGEKLNPPVGTARVHQLVQQARGLVLREFGKRQIGRALG